MIGSRVKSGGTLFGPTDINLTLKQQKTNYFCQSNRKIQKKLFGITIVFSKRFLEKKVQMKRRDKRFEEMSIGIK